jgi:hypothetical protein
MQLNYEFMQLNYEFMQLNYELIQEYSISLSSFYFNSCNIIYYLVKCLCICVYAVCAVSLICLTAVLPTST